ncbi:MAG: hypothetical protein NTX86_05325 [Candidatus Dependentiae bacterium]|nr:hypothetical protein [Candidatus Dependentiae bacterium]
MNLNFTLILQLFNFLCVYVLLRRFLLNPVVAIIKEDRSYQEDLYAQVRAMQSLIVDRHQEKALAWHNFVQACARTMPTIDQIECAEVKGAAPELKVIVLDDARVQELEKELSAAIIKRVEHVRI